MKDLHFWSATLIIFVTVLLMLATYTRVLRLNIPFQGIAVHHWLSWIGTLYIAFFTPAFYYLKRRTPEKLGTLLKLHVFGNLSAVALVSVHFTQQISRPPQAFPDLGTGIALYAATVLLALTGFLMRFQIVQNYRRQWKFIHTSVTVTFYLVIVVHILHGLALI